MQLPRGYLSYSAKNLWKKNKPAFRDKYYHKKPSYETAEMAYGKQVHNAIEKKESFPGLSPVTQFSNSEFELRTVIQGVPVLAYLDAFDMPTHSFGDYKTSHAKFDGSPPWTQSIVNNFDQLDFYSMIIENKFDTVNDECFLEWIETQKKFKTVDFDGIELTSTRYELVLTGRVEHFTRIVTRAQRLRQVKELVEIAHEIEADYKEFLAKNKNTIS